MRDINNVITGTLNAAAKTVTFNTAIDKALLLTIVNVEDNIEIYTANDATNGGTLNGGGTVLTVDYDTTSMSNSDLLQVIYEGVQSTNLARFDEQQSQSGTLSDILTSEQSIDNKTPALGQALAAGSVPVVLTAAQLSTLTPPAAITGFATAANQGTELTFLSAIQAQLVSNGAVGSTAANQVTEQGLTGSLTETAPGTDTASSGLNGRLQRIAQRLTSLITALGTPFQAGGSIGNTAFALNAGTNTIGKTYIAYQTTKALTNASVSLSSSGENTMVAGTASQTIRVFKIVIVAASAVSVSFKDAAGGTSLTGIMPMTANGSMVLESSDGEPLFVTATSGAFILNLSAAVAVTGFIQYTKS